MRGIPNDRITLSSQIATQVLKSPDAMVSFICIAADEMSLVDLQRVYCRFLRTLPHIDSKMNLKN